MANADSTALTNIDSNITDSLPDEMSYIVIDDDGMSPTFSFGDVAVIDSQVKWFAGDGIYRLRLPNGMLTIRRVIKDILKIDAYHVILDNKLYENDHIAGDMLDIVGCIVESVHRTSHKIARY